jgi:hypothetical protein
MSQHFGNKMGGLLRLFVNVKQCKNEPSSCTEPDLAARKIKLKQVFIYINSEIKILLLKLLLKEKLDSSDKKDHLDDLRVILKYLQSRQKINKSRELALITNLTEKKIKELEQLPDLVISHRNKMPLGGGGFMKCFGKKCSKHSSPGAAAGPSPSAQVKKSNSSSSGNLGGLGAVTGKRSSPHVSAASSPHASADSAKGKKSSRKSSSHGFTAYKKVLNEARDAAVQLGLNDVVNQADEFITEAELKEALKVLDEDADDDELTTEDNKYLDGLWEEIKNSKHPAKSVNVSGGGRRSGRGRSMRKRHTKRPTQKRRVTMRRVRRARNRRGGQACAKF